MSDPRDEAAAHDESWRIDAEVAPADYSDLGLDGIRARVRWLVNGAGQTSDELDRTWVIDGHRTTLRDELVLEAATLTEEYGLARPRSRWADIACESCGRAGCDRCWDDDRLHAFRDDQPAPVFHAPGPPAA